MVKAFSLRGNFSTEKVYPAACFSTLGKGSGSRRNHGFQAPFIFLVDNRAGEFGGTVLGMSRGFRGIAVPAGGNRNPNPRRCISPIDSSERGPFPLPECDSEAYPLILSERTRNAPWWDERAASGITEADGKKRPVVDPADGGASCPTSSRFPTSDPTRRWMTSTPPPIPIPSDAPTP